MSVFGIGLVSDDRLAEAVTFGAVLRLSWVSGENSEVLQGTEGLKKTRNNSKSCGEDQAASPELSFGDLNWHSEDKSSQSEVSGTHLHFTLFVFLSHIPNVMLRSTTKTKLPY